MKRRVLPAVMILFAAAGIAVVCSFSPTIPTSAGPVSWLLVSSAALLASMLVVILFRRSI